MSDISRFEGERAVNYDQFIGAWMPSYDRLMALFPRLIETEVSHPQPNLLVAGCGTGNEMLSLQNSGFKGKMTGVDPSPEMIAIARSKLTLNKQIELLEGRVEDLPVRNRFDVASLWLVLHFIPDDGQKLKLLRSIAQRLQKGAPLFLLDIFGDLGQIQKNLRILWMSLPEDIPPEESAYRIWRIENKLHYIPEERLLALLSEAGFERSFRFFQHSIYGAWIAYKS